MGGSALGRLTSGTDEGLSTTDAGISRRGKVRSYVGSALLAWCLVGPATGLVLAAAPAADIRYSSTVIQGEVPEGKAFVKVFSPAFAFRLQPIPHRWSVEVRVRGGEDDISRFTPPWHSVTPTTLWLDASSGTYVRQSWMAKSRPRARSRSGGGIPSGEQSRSA